MLEQIRSEDPDDRRAAYATLVGLLVHQGSRYPASALAVPWLIEIIADPAAPDRFAACQLLTSIAVGDEASFVVARLNPRQLRAEVERMASMGTQDLRRAATEWASAAPTADERQARMRSNGRISPELARDQVRWAVEADDSVQLCVPTFVGALTEPSPAVRLWTAHLVAWFPENVEDIAPTLVATMTNPE